MQLLEEEFPTHNPLLPIKSSPQSPRVAPLLRLEVCKYCTEAHTLSYLQLYFMLRIILLYWHYLSFSSVMWLLSLLFSPLLFFSLLSFSLLFSPLLFFSLLFFSFLFFSLFFSPLLFSSLLSSPLLFSPLLFSSFFSFLFSSFLFSFFLFFFLFSSLLLQFIIS